MTQHRRRSIRLQGYDYSQPGAYFVTICTQDRACLFGEIVGGEMLPNDAGQLVETVWNDIPQHIVRNDHELNKIREYITNNPAQWAMDRENAEATAVGTNLCVRPDNDSVACLKTGDGK